MKRAHNFQDLTGQVFGRLTVLSFHSMIGRKSRWLCQCKCGNEIVVKANSIKTGTTRSCGCLYSESRHEISRTHGLSNIPEYVVWQMMIQRCHNPKNAGYKNYGGRGIRVCKRWRGKNGFSHFISDMGRRPSSLHTVERTNNYEGYSPKNCIWATRAAQSINNRRNVLVKHEGKTFVLSELAKHLEVPYMRLYRRVKSGLSI